MKSFLRPLCLLAACVITFWQASHANSHQAAENTTPVPLDILNGELRSHLEKAAINSWHMDLQDMLVTQGEARSTQLSSGDAIKLSANVDAGYQIQRSGGVDSEGVNLRYNVSARKSIYHWGALEADHDSGLLGVEFAKYGRKIGFLNLYQSLVGKFADYVVIRQQEKDQLLSLELFKADLELFKDQVERGEMSSSKFAQEEVKYDRAKLAYESLKIRLERAESAFRTQAGLENSESLLSEVDLQPIPADISLIEAQVNAFIADIESVSLDYLQKKTRLDQADLALRRNTVNNRPKLDGLVRFRQDNETIATGDRSNLDLQETFAGVQFSWNIYDGGSTRGAVLSSMQSKRQLERELVILRDKIESDLRFMVEDLKILIQQNQLDEQDYVWATGGYNQGLVDVKEGRVSEKELRVLRRGVEVQKTKAFISRARYYKALASIHAAMESPAILSYLE